MAGLRIKRGSLPSIRASLNGLGGLTRRTARRQLKAGAEAIAKQAAEYAPYETGALEHSIESGPDGKKGELAYRVYIDPNATRPGGTPVTRYAGIVEKDYAGMKPGKGTLAKRAGGLDAGGFYMYRAVQELQPEIKKNLEKAIARRMRRLANAGG